MSETIIPVKLSEVQYTLFHKLAQLQDLEDWQLVLSYIRIGVDADAEANLYDLLPMGKDDVKGLIETFADD